MLRTITNELASEGAQQTKSQLVTPVGRYEAPTPPLDVAKSRASPFEALPFAQATTTPELPLFSPSLDEPLGSYEPLSSPQETPELSPPQIRVPQKPAILRDDTSCVVDETLASFESFTSQLPLEIDEELHGVVHSVLQKLPRAIDALKANDDIYWFRDYHGTLISVHEKWYDSEDHQGVSATWVLLLVLPLLNVVCSKPIIQGICSIAMNDLLSTMRGLSVGLSDDTTLVEQMLGGSCWSLLVNLMGRNQADIPYQAFRTAKLIVYNAPICEDVLAKGTGLGLGVAESQNADMRLYWYRIDLIEIIVTKIENLQGNASDHITVYLMRYAHQLEQAKSQERDVVLLRQIEDILTTIKSIISATAAVSPIVKRGRYYATLASYPAIGEPRIRVVSHSNSSGSQVIDEFDRLFPSGIDSSGACEIDSSLFRPPSATPRYATLPEGPTSLSPDADTQDPPKVHSWLRSWRSRRQLRPDDNSVEHRNRLRTWFSDHFKRIMRPFSATPASCVSSEIDTTLDVEIPNWRLRSWHSAYEPGGLLRPKL